MITKAMLERENAALREQVASLEKQLAQQKQVTLAWQESEARLQSVLNNLLDAAYRRNLRTGGYDYLSPVIEQLIGWSAEEMSNADTETVLARIHPDDLPYMQQEIERTMALCQATGRATGVLEYRFRTKAGDYRWLGDYLTLIADDDGQPLYRLGVVRDITDRKRIETALRESEIKFRSLFHNVPMSGVIYRLIRNEQNEIVDWELQDINKLGAADLNQKPSDLIGKRANELFGVEVMKPYLEACRTVVASNQSQNIETYFAHNDKYYLTALFVIGTEFYANVSIDITARLRSEEELRRSNAELEQFAYIASHDLQEPLRAVAGMVQLLQHKYQGRLDERADEYINHAVEAARRMQTLINDLLAYSRVGRRGKSFEAVNAETCLHSALQNLEVAIRESGANITYDTLPTITADVTQLTQLFQNLIGNSLKFRGQREPQIHIGITKMAEAWQFSVRDNGIGIKPEYFERIFLVFQRLHTRQEYPGTGIGLALCQKIVERHGGTIWVESQVGQGSTFYFTLPFRA